MTLSLIPDIDILIPFLPHRGPTHTVLALLIISAALFAYNKKCLPYSASYAAHLVSDVFTGTCSGNTHILRPITLEWFQHSTILYMGSLLESVVEVSLFLVATLVLVYFKDHQSLLTPSLLNLSLFIPSGAICASLISGIYGAFLPDLLLITHLVVFIAFIIILAKNLHGIDLKKLQNNT